MLTRQEHSRNRTRQQQQQQQKKKKKKQNNSRQHYGGQDHVLLHFLACSGIPELAS